jgi:hypothetical protein
MNFKDAATMSIIITVFGVVIHRYDLPDDVTTTKRIFTDCGITSQV